MEQGRNNLADLRTLTDISSPSVSSAVRWIISSKTVPSRRKNRSQNHPRGSLGRKEEIALENGSQEPCSLLRGTPLMKKNGLKKKKKES